jgi:serine/threonine-protein kinase
MAATTGSQRTVTQGQMPPNGLPTGASPQARYYEPPPSRTGWYALAAFFALIALGIGGVLLFNALSGDDEAGSNALRNYVGMNLDDAIADLDALGLSYRPVAEANTSVAENVVHRTDPPAGQIVVEGQTVYLYFNPPKELQPVPNVEGQPLADAQRILGAAGFQVADPPVFEQNDEIAENSVIRTDPPANERVEQDTVITLFVSSGPDQQAMPGIVVGQTVDAARAFLEAPPYSFRVTVTERETAAVNAGLVIETNPPANTLVDVGGQVTLVVSSGAPSADVPNVVGMTEQEARSALAEFDVSVNGQNLAAGDPNDGRVTAQSVTPGQRAPIGSGVTITVGRAAATTTTAAPTTTTTAAATTTTLAPAAPPPATPPP